MVEYIWYIIISGIGFISEYGLICILSKLSVRSE